MSALGYYFHIPQDYAEYLGGLRWTANGEAVEYSDRSTFAFQSQLGLFLRGLATTRGLLHFGHVLHLLQLLGVGKHLLPGKAGVLEQIYRDTGRPLRNAGAYCGMLCQQVPLIPQDLDADAVCQQLYSGSLMAIVYVSWNQGLPENLATRPALSPGEFEAVVLRALSNYTPAEIEHWLRHGRGPVKEDASQLAQELHRLQSRTLLQVLAELGRRARLSGAVPLVEQLVSALNLPPRRDAERELPVGGYTDVATRGQPEQMLSSQFALDGLEFVRRFAENELLFFRREEPHTRRPEELILLLDQGVRTWGEVRLLLCAAVLAFGKLAERRCRPFLLAGTSNAGSLLSAREATVEELGELLDASDLSPHPGLALETVLEQPAGLPRDVVLLTHPRNLIEPDVAVAARRASGETRLFSLTADGEGQVELSQLRGGRPVTFARLQVDLCRGMPPPRLSAPGGDVRAWRGDVEPIPLPFRLGLVSNLDFRHFDFDHAGKWLFVNTTASYVHAFCLDDSLREVLPRPVLEGQLVVSQHGVLGVTGGCVVAGKSRGQIVVAHYDLKTRVCKVHAQPDSHDLSSWAYFVEFHALVLQNLSHRYGLDLDTGTWCRVPHDWAGPPTSRAESACSASLTVNSPRSLLNLAHNNEMPRHLPTVRLMQATGQLSFEGMATPRPAFTPRADGQPLLGGAHLANPAHLQGDVLVVYTHGGNSSSLIRLRAFRLPEGVLLGEFTPTREMYYFTLSADGSLLARVPGTGPRARVEVRDLHRGMLTFFAPTTHHHPNLLLELSRMALVILVGKMTHQLEWQDGRLRCRFTRQARSAVSDKQTGRRITANTVATVDDLRRLGHLDGERFVRAAQGDVTALVDRFGHVTVLDRAGQLVCMFFVFREKLAGWMPDGTRFGPAKLTGGEETPQALDRFGQALLAASQRGEKRP